MISYCPHCGEYLGDYVSGVLFKFSQRVTEPHLCPGQSCADGEGGLSRDYLDEIDRLAHYEAQREVKGEIQEKPKILKRQPKEE